MNLGGEGGRKLEGESKNKQNDFSHLQLVYYTFLCLFACRLLLLFVFIIFIVIIIIILVKNVSKLNITGYI